MENYEKMSASEVQRLAKQGNKDALFEMVWRLELLPPEHRNDPVERCAWQDYWFEKAANAGHVDAKIRYARSLIDRVMNAEDRQKAMGYFQSLSEDFDAGKLNRDQQQDGALAKFWLGIMLCQGYHTRRDAIKGVELIQAANALTNGFEGFGFVLMYKIGEVYATGLAQPGEEPSIADLEKAIKYLDIAIKRFNPEKNKSEMLDLVKQLLGNCKGRIEAKKREGEDAHFTGAGERRRKMMEISPAARQRMEADKAAFARLSQRLAREGW